MPAPFVIESAVNCSRFKPLKPSENSPQRARLSTPEELRELAAVFRKAGADHDADHVERIAKRYEAMSTAERDAKNTELR